MPPVLGPRWIVALQVLGAIVLCSLAYVLFLRPDGLSGLTEIEAPPSRQANQGPAPSGNDEPARKPRGSDPRPLAGGSGPAKRPAPKLGPVIPLPSPGGGASDQNGPVDAQYSDSVDTIITRLRVD